MVIEIPVILSSDENYAKYLDVTLVSCLSNGKKGRDGTFFDVYILTAPDFSEESKRVILKDAKKYSNNKINFVDMKDSFSNLKRMISHISNPTYYRLNAAKILPEKYDKCLYFDTDVAVNIDLQEYYNIDIGDNLIAGVKAAGYHMNADGNQRLCKLLEIPNINTYVNAGVIIMNLKKIREENLTEVFNEISQNNYPSVDQDVLNKVCFGRIKTLPLEYNVMTTYKFFNPTPEFVRVYGVDEINNAVKRHKIIHYADKVKPWQNLWILFAPIWWKYALKTSYLGKILFELLFWEQIKQAKVFCKRLNCFRMSFWNI